MKKPIIFLDIDGVITTERTKYSTGDPTCVDIFNRAAKELDADIVISSTWRFAHNYVQNIRRLGIEGNIIGCTPIGHTTANGVHIYTSRGEEIKRWLELYAVSDDPAPFVIIDDDDDVGDLINHLVHTSTEHGLVEEDYERIIHTCRRQRPGDHNMA